MNPKSLKKRINIVVVNLCLILLLFCIQFINVVDSALKMSLEYEDPNIKRGNFYDTNMTPITYYDETGKRLYNNGYIFSPILGYNSKKYGRSGLESRLNETLLYSDIKHKQGNDVILTIDINIQENLFNAISEFGEKSASAVVINAKTGEILAMVNNPSYDPEKIDEEFEALLQYYEIFINKATSPIIPGSVFKLVTSTLFVKEGIQEEI